MFAEDQVENSVSSVLNTESSFGYRRKVRSESPKIVLKDNFRLNNNNSNNQTKDSSVIESGKLRTKNLNNLKQLFESSRKIVENANTDIIPIKNTRKKF